MILEKFKKYENIDNELNSLLKNKKAIELINEIKNEINNDILNLNLIEIKDNLSNYNDKIDEKILNGDLNDELIFIKINFIKDLMDLIDNKQSIGNKKDDKKRVAIDPATEYCSFLEGVVEGGKLMENEMPGLENLVNEEIEYAKNEIKKIKEDSQYRKKLNTKYSSGIEIIKEFINRRGTKTSSSIAEFIEKQKDGFDENSFLDIFGFSYEQELLRLFFSPLIEILDKVKNKVKLDIYETEKIKEIEFLLNNKNSIFYEYHLEDLKALNLVPKEQENDVYEKMKNIYQKKSKSIRENIEKILKEIKIDLKKEN